MDTVPKIPELNKRILYTLLILIIYRLGVFIPVPGVDSQEILKVFTSQGKSFFDIINLFSGGAFERASIFALGVMPYITSSIVMSLVVKTFPSLEEMQKDQLGKKKISQYSRYLTILICFFQGSLLVSALQTGLGTGAEIVYEPGFSFFILTIATLTAGTFFVMWLGEQISEKGIGNGISIIIFISIVSGLPTAVGGTLELASTGELNSALVVMILVLAIAVTAFVVFVERGQRKITVNYARRQQGRKMVQAQSSYLPLKLNMAGVIPPIFASSIILFPSTFCLLYTSPSPRDGLL